MSVLVTRPGSLDDLVSLESRRPDAQAQIISVIRGAPDRDLTLAVFSRAVLKDGRPIAMFGVWPVWKGVGEAWTLLSEESIRHPKSLHRSVLTELDRHQRQQRLRRVQAVVNADSETGIRWIERLGFEREGLLRGYGQDGEDMLMYARLRTWKH